MIDAAKDEGYLYYEEYDECFADEIALKHEWNYNDTRIAVALMFKAKLIEQVDETTFFFPQVAEVVGSETESAVRMRRKRGKSEENRHNVTGSRHIVQKCDTEIDIEKESEKEIESHTDIDIDCDLIYRGECNNVILLDWQWKKLKEMFPNNYRERVDRLSRYISRTGKNYPSHYATIVSWAKEDGQINEQTAKAAKEEEKKGSFDTDSFFDAIL